MARIEDGELLELSPDEAVKSARLVASFVYREGRVHKDEVKKLILRDYPNADKINLHVMKGITRRTKTLKKGIKSTGTYYVPIKKKRASPKKPTKSAKIPEPSEPQVPEEPRQAKKNSLQLGNMTPLTPKTGAVVSFQGAKAIEMFSPDGSLKISFTGLVEGKIVFG
jgi:hypothetical protein